MSSLSKDTTHFTLTFTRTRKEEFRLFVCSSKILNGFFLVTEQEETKQNVSYVFTKYILGLYYEPGTRSKTVII